MTSQSGLISDWLWSIKGMDRSYFIDVDPFFIHSAPEGNVLCPSIVQIIDKIYDSVDLNCDNMELWDVILQLSVIQIKAPN